MSRTIRTAVVLVLIVILAVQVGLSYAQTDGRVLPNGKVAEVGSGSSAPDSAYEQPAGTLPNGAPALAGVSSAAAAEPYVQPEGILPNGEPK